MGQEPSSGGAPVSEQRDPDAIREDIESTRQDVGDTVEALAAKADVKRQAKAKVEDVKERIGDKSAESTARLKEATPESAGAAASAVSAKARKNTVPLGLAAAAVAGFLLGRLTARR
jgi:ElaB/YqjD/DUF883 family membrane-anchored ribosome-binding protein